MAVEKHAEQRRTTAAYMFLARLRSECERVSGVNHTYVFPREIRDCGSLF